MATKRKKRAAAPSVETKQGQIPVSRVTFKYVFPEDYNPVYANGAYGGVTSQREIAVNFYVERTPIPFEETYRVQEEGRLGERIARRPEQIEDGELRAIRFITTGVIMKADVARRVYEFLGRHLANLERSDPQPSDKQEKNEEQAPTAGTAEQEQD